MRGHAGVDRKTGFDRAEVWIVKVACFILGLLGSLVGFLVVVLEGVVGGVGSAVGTSGSHTVLGLAWLAFACCLLGIVGASLVLGGRHKVGSWLTLVAGLLGFIAASAFWIPSGIMLVLGGLLGFGAGPKNQQAAAPTA